MKEIRYIYDKAMFKDVSIKPAAYEESFFNLEIELESEVFYKMRKENEILPYALRDSSPSELEEIREFFSKNAKSFFFLFEGNALIGSVLLLSNYIQCLAVSTEYQRKGYGAQLVKYAVNYALSNGAQTVELTLVEGNTRAQNLYRKIGFKEKEA